MSNAMLIKGNIVTPDTILPGGCVYIRDGYIVHIGPEMPSNLPDDCQFIDAGEDGIVSPGFIDIHVHGAGGYDFMEGTPESQRAIAETWAKYGTTGLLATTVSAAHEDIMRVAKTTGLSVRESRNMGEWKASRILGMHIEGPFINPSCKGAQPIEAIRPINKDEFDLYMQESENNIKLFTFAPELSGAAEFTRYLVNNGVVPTAGHTAATYDESMECIRAGLSHITHTFNGMKGLHHREPGILGAALTTKGVTAQVISDGYHLHPAIVSLIVKCKGDETILVTDAMEAVGMPEGEYSLGGNAVTVRDGKCTLADGTIASSVLTMNSAVRNVIDYTGCTLVEAVRMASLNPAKVVGMSDRFGSIEQGKIADIVVMDYRFNVLKTIISGKVIYSR